jgi:predicted DNA-binding protein with PD1-like motif
MKLLAIAALFTLSSCAFAPKNKTMQIHALRLTPGQDLKKELDLYVKNNHLEAAYILTCVGSLRKAVLRPANQKIPLIREEKLEIVSLVGTLSPAGSHIHISLSDSTGATIGGHLLEGNLIYTTAEIVLGNAPNLVFTRENDPKTGYKELKINKKD